MVGTTVLLVGALASGCSEYVDSGEWNVEQEQRERVDFPVIQGKYNAEWEILEDTCEPSLEELMSQWEDWPPPQRGIVVRPGEQTASGFPSMWSHRYLLRHFGRGGTGRAGLYQDYSPLQPTLFEFTFPPERSLRECPMGSDGKGANYQDEIRAKAVDEGEIVIEVHTTWQDYDNCDEYELSTSWIPTEYCTESYRVRMTLAEACEPLEECKTVVRHSSRSESGEQPPHEVREVDCVCD